MQNQNTISSQKRKNLKPKTLKESYQQRRLLAEKARRADELLIAEQTANMLLEALDKDELKQASQVLKKLVSIKKVADSDPELAPLGDAIKQASDDVNKFMGGGIGAFLKKGISKLAGMFGAKAGANPILKSLTLLNCLESGLDDLPTLIKNNIPEYDEGSDKSTFDQAPDDKVKKNLAQAMTKAFRPEGVFSKIKSLFDSGGMPYVENVDKLIVGMLAAKPKSLSELIKIAKSGISSEDAAGAVQDMVQPSGGGEKAAAGKQQPVTSTDQLAQAYARGTAIQKKQDPAAAAAEAEKDPKKFTQAFMADIEKRSGQKSAVVKAVITTLVKKKKLLGDLQVDHRLIRGRTLHESWKSKRKIELTLEDITAARQLLRESRGSIKKWIHLLAEEATKEDKSSGGGEGNSSNPRAEIATVPIDDLKALSQEVEKEKINSEDANKLLDDAIENAFNYIDNLAGDKDKEKEPYKIAKKAYESKTSKETNAKIKSLNTLNTISVDLLKKAGEETLKAAASAAQEYKAANEELLAQIEDAKKAKEINSKHAKFIKDVQEELDGIEPKAIESILDAIPEFMKVAA